MVHVDESLAMIHSNGEVWWNPQVIMEASCLVNVKDFPRDEVTCRLQVVYEGLICSPKYSKIPNTKIKVSPLLTLGGAFLSGF